MRHTIRAKTIATAIAATWFVAGASAATSAAPVAPTAACAWDHREFQNLGNGDYTLRFAPLDDNDDRSMGGYLGYLSIHHPARGQIYTFDLFQGNGYATVKLLDHEDAGADAKPAKKAKPKANKPVRLDDASAPLELFEFDERLLAANGRSAKYIFIPRLGQTDYYNGRPAKGNPQVDPRDPKFRLNDNLWQYVGCR